MLSSILHGLSWLFCFLGLSIWFLCLIDDEMLPKKSLLGKVVGASVVFVSIIFIIWFSSKNMHYVLIGIAITVFIMGVIYGVGKFIRFLQK